MAPLEQGLRLFLLVLPVVDAGAAYLLLRAVHRAGGWSTAPGALRERCLVALGTLVAASLMAAIALHPFVGSPFTADVILVSLAVAVTIPSALSLQWVWRYWYRRF